MATTRKHEELDAPILRLVRGMCREAEHDARKRGRVTMSEICEQVTEECGVVLKSRHEAGPLKRLLDSGDLVRFKVLEGAAEFGNGGGSYTYRVADLDDVNLASIIEFAREHQNPDLELRKGRNSTRAGHATRVFPELKDTQVDMAERAARALVEHRLPWSRPKKGDGREENQARLAEAMRTIGLTDLVWADGVGTHGLGDWAILEELEAACVAKGLGQNTNNRYVGALRTLLDHAATHGLLLQRDVHGAERSYLPTAWAPALERWNEIFQESEHRTDSMGTAQLARIMGEMAEFFADSLDEVDPLGLNEEQTHAFTDYLMARLDADHTVTSHQRSITLCTLRALIEGGVLKEVALTAYDRRRIDGRKSAFESSAIKAIAREFDANSRKASADYGLFKALGKGPFFDPENRYSLPFLVDWFTLKSVRRRRPRGLSAVNAFPRANVRRGGGLSGKHWSKATLLSHLELLGTYLGYLVRYHNIDLDSEVDARHLFTRELLDGFAEAVDQDEWTTEHRALDLIYNVSLYTSPCWETAALAEGDSEQADAFQTLADYAAGRGSEIETGFDGLTLHKSQKDEWGLVDGRNFEGQKRRAQQVEKAYNKATAETYAYVAMLRIRNAGIRRFCNEVGVENLQKLLAEIEEGTTRIQPHEFTTLRNLMVWSDALAAPNRRKTVALTDTSDRHEKPNGELWADIDAEKMKVSKNGDYELLLGVRGKETSMGYRFDLWDAFKAARKQFLAGRPSDVMYPSTQPGEAEDDEDPFRLAPGSISDLYRKALEYGAAELEWDITPILALNGLASSHASRHAVGTFMVAHNQMDLARRMLHHKGMDTLMKVYTAGPQGESASSVTRKVLEGAAVA